MPNSAEARLNELLQPNGLLVLGDFFPEPGEVLPGGQAIKPGRRLVLVGNAGSAMWAPFRNSPEFRDGFADALDRWSRRIGMALAAELDGQVVFPFDGPPYPQFQQWAARSGQAFASPVSLSIHHQYGLWHAYRFALLMPARDSALHDAAARTSPCLSCEAQPCLDPCPVQAFSDGGYLVQECADYLGQDSSSSCRLQGCLARRTCPQAGEYHYEPEHAQFHMDAFVRSMFPESK